MHYLLIAAYFLGPIAGAASVDRLIAYRHKASLHKRAVHYWCKLCDTSIPDLPRAACGWTLNLLNKWLTNKTRSFLIYACAAFIFICLAATIPNLLTHKSFFLDVDGDFFDRLPMPHIIQIVPVMLFDMFTIYLTRRMLIAVQKGTNAKAIIGIGCHGIFLIALLILCLGVFMQVGECLMNQNSLGTRAQHRDFAAYEFALYEQVTWTNKEVVTNIQNIEKRLTFMGHQYNKPFTNALAEYSTKETQFISDAVHIRFVNTLRFDIQQAAFCFDVLLIGKPVDWELWSIAEIDSETAKPEIVSDLTYTEVDLGSFLFCATLIFPAICLVIGLLFLFVCKCLLIAFRVICMYSLELLTDKKEAELIPFTLLATAASIVIGMLDLLVTAVHRLYQ